MPWAKIKTIGERALGIIVLDLSRTNNEERCSSEIRLI